jgi:hypothetical protein
MLHFYPKCGLLVELILGRDADKLSSMPFPKKLARLTDKKVTLGERGQSIILISVVILSFLLFFQFAINTGILVIAKISLQNAADAAAYAGAATQARQLNAISFLNYDMREQYKKFLYRYVFVGNVGGPQFPNSADPAPYGFPKMDYSINPSSPVMKPINVPVICMPIKDGADDSCLQINLPNTANNVANSFSGIISAPLQATLASFEAIAQIQQKLCQGQGTINFAVAMAWLFRGDTSAQSLISGFSTLANDAAKQTTNGNAAITSASIDKTISLLQNNLQGMGLFPRNIITLMRIETMVSILNQPHASQVDLETVQGWEASQAADQHERTAQAFRSAAANLNQQVLNPSKILMDELEADQQITVAPILKNFNVYVQMMKVGADASRANSTICQTTIFPFPVIGAPLGVTRTNTTSVHYAVKIHATANLLFLPMKDGIELEAVAGAKPFGSRIGPSDTTADTFTMNVAPVTLGSNSGGGGAINDCFGPAACDVPNLQLNGAESFYSGSYLTALAGAASTAPRTYSSAGFMKALSLALSPNPMEVGRYSILPPPQDAPGMSKGFIPYATDQTSLVYRFYAPLFLSGGSDPNEKIDAFIGSMFASTQTANSSMGINYQNTGDDIKTTIHGYISSGIDVPATSENGESSTFAAVLLPMPVANLSNPNPKFWLTQPNQVLTSWGPSAIPRFGYSVKFVTLQNLKSEGMPFYDDDLEKVSH